MKDSRLLVLLLLLPAVAPAGLADEPHQHEHGAPPEKLGKVNFAVSCSEAVIPQFERGVALLHSFWYDAAEKAFLDVAKADPSCAMAYWGVAMSNFHPIWAAGNPGAEPSPAELQKGAEAVAKARAAGAKTERERDYIAGVEAFYHDASTLDHRARSLAFESSMERVYSKYPRDRESGIFYALAILGTVSPADKTYTAQKKAAGILNRILPEAPEHPGIAHYLIHSFDYPPLASLALPAARSYAKIASDAPHALHMPSHIFTRLGLWEDSIQSNLASSAAAQRYVARAAPGVTSFDDLHASDYLEYAYLQLGRDAEARGVVERVARVERLDAPNFAAAYALAAVPTRYAVERGKWSDAARLEARPSTFPWEKFRNAEAILCFGRALGAARSGDLAAAREAVGRLETIQSELDRKGDKYWSGQVEIQRLEAASWIARAERKDEEALRMARSAADLEGSTDKHAVTPGSIVPARELLGDLLLDLQQPGPALQEYEASLAVAPNRFHGLAGAGRAARAAGDQDKARTYSAKLLALAGRGDADRADIDDAKRSAARDK
jgi:tetratricopeptide (TPR) repeat protein